MVGQQRRQSAGGEEGGGQRGGQQELDDARLGERDVGTQRGSRPSPRPQAAWRSPPVSSESPLDHDGRSSSCHPTRTQASGTPEAASLGSGHDFSGRRSHPPPPSTGRRTTTSAVTYLRALAMDAVQRVGNGHPGTAMALAPVAYLLFQKVMRHDPKDPAWLGRDRFVLSPGHSSLTLYSQLFLSELRPHDGRPRGLPHLGQPDPRAPGARAHRGRGDHDRPARPGTRHRSGHGHGRPVRAWAARPRRPGRDEPLRPPRLVHRGRRRPRGGHHVRGVVARRACSTSTASSSSTTTTTSRSRATPRSPSTEDVTERYRAYGWATHRVEMNADGSIDVAGVHAAIARGPGRGQPADVHPGPQHDRVAGAEPAEHRARCTAAHWASPRSGRPRRSWASTPTSTSRSRTTCSLASAPTCGTASTPQRGPWDAAFAEWRAAHAGQRGPARPAAGPRSPRRLRVGRAGLRRGRLGVHPEGLG